MEKEESIENNNKEDQTEIEDLKSENSDNNKDDNKDDSKGKDTNPSHVMCLLFYSSYVLFS